MAQSNSKPRQGVWHSSTALWISFTASWIARYKTLSEELQNNGRLRLYAAIAYMDCGNLDEAKQMLNESFAMTDIKEGELSISAVWAKLYGDEKPLPKNLNFRMHETKEE